MADLRADDAALRQALRQASERDRGFVDGRAGRGRAHGGNAYMEGYDDGLDQYDLDNAESEGWRPCE